MIGRLWGVTSCAQGRYWGGLGTLLQQEGSDPRVSETFYRSMFKAIPLYDSEKWVLSEAMKRKVEGSHTGLFRYIMGKRARRIGDGMWDTPGIEVVRETAGTQSVMTYIGRQKATVTQWGALWPLFEVCARDKGWKGVDTGGRLGGANRRQINNFGPPWQDSRGKLIGWVNWDRVACSRSQREVVFQIGKSECWYGDGIRPCGRMTLCGRRRFWYRYGWCPGGRMNLCGSYGED